MTGSLPSRTCFSRSWLSAKGIEWRPTASFWTESTGRHDARPLDVARAQRARMLGDPEYALELLRPLVGKSVDPIGGAVFEEELTRSALATHRDFEAISYMDAWLRGSGGEDRDTVAHKIALLVTDLPTSVLRAALDAIRARRATYGYGADIERILTD